MIDKQLQFLHICILRSCEIFYSLQVHHILNEIVMGGMVLETNMTEILTHIEAQNKLEKQEVCSFLFCLFKARRSIN